MDNQFILRRADISDINALSHLSQKTFRETFMEDLSIPYTVNDLDSYFQSSASPEYFASKIIDPKRAVWLIEDKKRELLLMLLLVLVIIFLILIFVQIKMEHSIVYSSDATDNHMDLVVS
jgi:hypothetical protein